MTHCILGLLANTEPAPAWILDRLARPDRRAPLAAVDGFEYDRPRSIAAAYGHMGHLVDTGDVPVDGNRDDHLYRFLARMHGIGVGKERAHALYDEFLQLSGGAAPDGWPNDEKSWAKIRRIWDGGGADNPPGSELAPLTLSEAAAPLTKEDRDRLPDDRLWDMEDLVNGRPLDRWDADKLFVKAASGYVGMWFGASQHHKTNFALSKIFELMTTTDAKVLYLLGEGIDGMGARLRAQASFLDRSTLEFHGRFKAYRVPHATIAAEINQVIDFCVAAQFKPDIVIIDTVSTATSGLDENNTTASMLNGNGQLGRLARVLGCHLIFIGHEADGKPGKPRGGTGYYANPDQVVYIKANAPGKHALALAITSTPPHGKSRDGHETVLWYAIQWHMGVPVPVKTSKAGYEMLTGDKDWNGSSIAAAVAKLGQPVGAEAVVMEMHPRGDMDPEDWQARCATLARKLDRAARDGNPALPPHLYEITDDIVRWRVS